jgi:hypothetical protein
MNWKGFGWKRSLVEVYHSILLQGLRNTTESSGRITNVLAKFRTKHLPNTAVEHCCYTSLFGLVTL